MLHYWGFLCTLVSMPYTKDPPMMRHGCIGMPKYSSKSPNLLMIPTSKCGSILVPYSMCNHIGIMIYLKRVALLLKRLIKC